MRAIILGCAICAVVYGDIYISSLRGSNNRLNEDSANRDNANRLFNSQNNNRGGYNVGDRTEDAAETVEDQYQMNYFQSETSTDAKSHLTVEWVNQHGCGGNEDTDPAKQNCNLVLQYMCQDADEYPLDDIDSIRDGLNTETPRYSKPSKNEAAETRISRRFGNIEDLERGQQEPWENYDKCYVRERNQGLFTADQNLKKNKFGYSSAVFTRQNRKGERYGYECPEERDYYPYWHPTPWKDIAIMSDSESRCDYYQENSFNVQPYGECVEFVSGAFKGNSRWNNEADCTAEGGTWTLFHNYLEKAPQYTTEAACEQANVDFASQGIEFIYEVPYNSSTPDQKECLVALNAPECFAAPWSRSNHLGNGLNAEPNNYTWVLPFFPSLKPQRCVLRMRYNISTDDYDPYNTDSTHNNNRNTGTVSPVTNDPYEDIGVRNSPLRLAINTAQFGRTFQDRTHVFILKPRTDSIKGAHIYNLNVRGKRGNIVQAFPAVEYDFFPTHMFINRGDLVHIQWTGSNTHNNGNPAGDGQSGDAGQGRDGTDRHNFVQMENLNYNYPTPWEKATMIKEAEVKWIAHSDTDLSSMDTAINLASSGYYQCAKEGDCADESVDAKETLNGELDNAPASYGGVVLKFKSGEYFYMSTRNNAFTNRSQKGSLTVTE